MHRKRNWSSRYVWYVWLLAILMVAPSDAWAQQQLGLGLGYAKDDCSITDAGGAPVCFDGGRMELSWNFASSEGVIRDSERSHASSSGSGGSFNWINFPSGGRGDEFVVLVLVAFLLIAGIFWLVTYLFSARTKLGMYYSADALGATKAGTDDFDRYYAQRLGFQLTFYPFHESSFGLHLGLAAADAVMEVGDGGDAGTDYHLQGVSSKAGLGYAPQLGESGPLFLLEAEGIAFTDRSILKVAKANNARVFPATKSSASLMLGWAHSF